MKHADYIKLPQGVRNRFSSYDDAMFADHPEVVSARNEIISAESAHAVANGATVALIDKKAALEDRLAQTKATLQALRETRRRAVVEALLADWAIPAAEPGEAALLEIIDALPEAIEAIGIELSRAQRKSEHSGQATVVAGLALERLLERLKLERAHREAA